MSLKNIAQEISNCTKCDLHKNRNNTVPGEGDPKAKIMFVGEGPGEREDLKGKPFVGDAGKLLDYFLKLADLKRENIFITNLVKCRPPGNRDPREEEIETCTKLYLQRQIKLIKPLLTVTLGRHAMNHFLPDSLKISKVHGQPKRMVNSKTGESQIYYPVYHPAAVLYHKSLKATIEKDFKKLPKVLEKIKNEK